MDRNVVSWGKKGQDSGLIRKKGESVKRVRKIAGQLSIMSRINSVAYIVREGWLVKGLETAATVTAVYVFYVVRQTIVIIFLGSFDIYV